MKINEAIRKIMKEKGVTQNKIIEMVNGKAGETVIKSQSIIAERLKRGETMQMDKALELLEALDYEIVIQPKSTRGKRANGAYVIDMQESDAE